MFKHKFVHTPCMFKQEFVHYVRLSTSKKKRKKFADSGFQSEKFCGQNALEYRNDKYEHGWLW